MTVRPFRISLIYMLVGALWVLASDWLLTALAPTGLVPGQTLKGLFFVAAGAAFLYLLSRRVQNRWQELEQEHRELERRLGAVARLEAIGQLTGGIAHDFNNLLTAISGNIEAYVEQHPERVAVSEELREIRRSADRAADLTRQLLAFGRPSLDPPPPVDLNQRIRGMATLLHRLIGDRIRIRTEFADHLRPVRADPGRLEQVVMNLVLNARDAMPDGGQVTLRTGVHQNRFVRLDVIDSGHGMPQELQARIFEPYFTTKSEGTGTGLGLLTVQSVLKEAGGYITVRSAPGAGATFSVFLPFDNTRPSDNDAASRNGTAALSTGPAPTRPVASGTETVLVAEDDPAVRALVVRVLRERGFVVLEASGGQAALRQLGQANGGIDMLITDAVMPDMTGMEVISAARAACPEMRALLISGYSGDQFAADIPYLAKPFTAVQLLERVRHLLDA
jgi:two-component system, cell cycle sensor histidine kinase and response regulator CckA